MMEWLCDEEGEGRFNTGSQVLAHVIQLMEVPLR